MTTKPKGIQSAFADIRADYDMTRHSRFVRRRTGVASMGSGPDYHFRSESKYYEAIEQARDMDRNDALVGILADRRVDNIVQSGFTLDPKTGDKGLDLALWQWWEDFANDPDQCDIAGEYTWKEIERQCSRSESIDGDIVVTGTEEGSFQLLESHLIRTKSKLENTFLGVTTNRVGRRIQYHVAEELNEFGTFGDSLPIDVRNSEGVRQVFHVYNPKRVNPTRGVTQLAPVFSISGMLEDINFAKLVQQQVVSCFAVFRKLAASTSSLPSVDGVYGEGSTQQTESGTRQIEGVSPGMEIVGQPGEELGLPLCLVLMDGSETNFSGWRGAVDEARKGFVADQLNLVRRLNRPAYRWKLSQHLAETKDRSLRKAYSQIGDRIFTHNWNLPTWSYIEPVADAEGDATQLRNALTSPRRLHAARGKDWEEIAEESIADNAYAIERAAKQAADINASFPDGPMITWRDLISLPMPQGVTVSMQDPGVVKAQVNSEDDESVGGPTAKSKIEPKASGGWRTTEDGGRVFIGDDGEPRIGGPSGPKVKDTERLRDRIEGTQAEADKEVSKADKKVAQIKQKLEKAESKIQNDPVVKKLSQKLDKLADRKAEVLKKLEALRAKKNPSASNVIEDEEQKASELESLLGELQGINKELDSLSDEATDAA
jgi:capsid protein